MNIRINNLIRKLIYLERKESKIEDKKDNIFDKIDKLERKSIKKEMRKMTKDLIQCPICSGRIKFTGDKTAECRICDFGVCLSTVSDKQDEYILYSAIFEKPVVIVNKINKKRLYTYRYLKPSELKQVLTVKKLIKNLEMVG